MAEVGPRGGGPHRSAALRAAPSEPHPDRSSDLREAVEASGYYPNVVLDGVTAALAGEPVRSFVVHHEPTFDRDEVRRHVTVVALTHSRLVVGHTDEHPADDLLPEPYTATTTEAIPLASVASVVVNRMVANPDRFDGAPLPADAASEAVVTIGWGAVGRIELEPAVCSDPACEADHGYTGSISADDFSLRVSTAADGVGAVDRLLAFARDLSAATARR